MEDLTTHFLQKKVVVKHFSYAKKTNIYKILHN